jgi:conjugal transfer pilus assembly protein TraU
MVSFANIDLTKAQRLIKEDSHYDYGQYYKNGARIFILLGKASFGSTSSGNIYRHRVLYLFFRAYILSLIHRLVNSRVLLVICIASLLPNTSFAKCTGRFVNPITDICWECLFPISIGSAKIASSNNPDTDNPSSPICFCGTPIPRVGIAAGFWEPVRLVDVSKKPFCFPNLGGVEFSPGIHIGTGASPRSTSKGTGSWHVHWYIYPLIYWLELLTDFACLEASSFDVAYLTELDPLWSDDSLAYIINPEAALFANPIAQAACAADCVASTVSSPMDSLFWCGGCQGSLYPLDGNIQGHVGSIQSALLATERFTYKLHRQGLAWGTSGSEALCQKYIMPVMKKSQYRAQLTVPVPSSCYPFGRTTTLYETGKEVPIVGEDFGFLIWRKRNCCVL